MSAPESPKSSPSSNHAGQEFGLTPARLRAWLEREERRRRRARPGLAALSPWLYSALAGVLLAAEVMRSLGVFGAAARGDAGFVGASRLWLAVLGVGHVLVVFGAPFRMFWRRDSAFLARLPLRGEALFRLALVRSVRATGLVALPCLLAALAFGPWLAWEAAVRHLALLAAASAVAALLGPAAALAAGAVVASDKADALLENLGGGEFRAPKSSWLGVLPGLVATALALVVIASANWIVGAPSTALGDPLVLLAPTAALPVLALVWALRSAGHVMLEATREVAALDQERLAHVERTRPTAVDRLIMARLEPRARAVFDKDARLLRRRYPMPYFLGLVGVLALWILAAAAPAELLPWSVAITAGLGIYGVVMARRLVLPPVEEPRLLATLPVGGRPATRAKRIHALSWIAVYPVLGALPTIARSEAPLRAGLILGLVLVGAGAAAAYVAGRGELR